MKTTKALITFTKYSFSKRCNPYLCGVCQVFHTHSFLRLPLVRFHFELQFVHQILKSGNILLVLLSLEAVHSIV